MQQQTAAIEDLQSGVSSVTAGQQKLLEDVTESMAAVTQLHEAAQIVEQGMRDSQAVHQQLLESEKNVAVKLAALESRHEEHAEAVRKTWKVKFWATLSTLFCLTMSSTVTHLRLEPLSELNCFQFTNAQCKVQCVVSCDQTC
jgi:hypothetical protein